MSRARRLTLATITAASAAALLLSGCTSAPEATDEHAAEMNQEIHDMLPDHIKAAGEIKVGTEAFYPPMEYYDEDQETIIGVDPDIIDALSEVLGVKLKLQNLAWDALLPALDAGRIDMVTAAMGINEERIQKYDFVSYFNTVQGVTVLAENAGSVAEPKELCGLNVSVLDGSHQLDLLDQLNADTCGDDPMTVMPFPAESDALQQLQNGRADALLSQYPAAAYNARTFGKGKTFVATPMEDLTPQILGEAFRKDEPELRDAVLAAMNEIINSGAYAEVLKANDLENGAIDQSEVNPLVP